MKVVLLAGGFGSRISEESVFKPKPMIEIGGMPILWHIMKEYAYYGHKEFIICAGYKQEYIKEWFANYFGYNTMTGGRIRRVKEYVGNETFLMTYGDGVCDVDINRIIEFHKSHGKIATLTAVKQLQDKGVLNIGGDNAVKSFREKSSNDGASINAGYMVLEPSIFNYLTDDNCVLEQTPLRKLVEDGQLMSYIHTGFWQCMDNIREKTLLEKLLASNAAPWKRWGRTVPQDNFWNE